MSEIMASIAGRARGKMRSASISSRASSAKELACVANLPAPFAPRLLYQPAR